MIQKPEYYWITDQPEKYDNPICNVDGRIFLSTQDISILFARHFSKKYFISILRSNDEVQEISHVFQENEELDSIVNTILDFIEIEGINCRDIKFSKGEKEYKLSRINVFLFRKLKRVDPLVMNSRNNSRIEKALEPTVGMTSSNLDFP